MAALTVFSAGALAQHGAIISHGLQDVDLNSNVDVIVQFRQLPTAVHHQKVINLGGRLKTELRLIKGGLYSLPAASVPALAADPDVAIISPDRKIHMLL